MKRATRCARCAAPLRQPSTGRPKVYCSARCRDHAGHDRMRAELAAINERFKQLALADR